MGPDWLARVAAARHAPAAGVALLAAAARAGDRPGRLRTPSIGPAGRSRVSSTPPVCLLALLATVPLLFLRPAAGGDHDRGGQRAAARLVRHGHRRGRAAQLIAAYRVGAAKPRLARDPRWVNRTGSTSRAGRASALGWPTRRRGRADASAADSLGVTSRRGLADAAGTAGDAVPGGVAWAGDGDGACPAPGR